MTRKSLSYLRKIISAIVILVIMILVVFLIVPTKRQDWFLNLMASFVGTLLGVYIIEASIEWLAELRRLRVKYLLYTQLLEIVDDFLVAVLPAGSYEISSKDYVYGEIHIIPLIEPLTDEMLSQVPTLVEQSIESHKSFDEAPFSAAKQRLQIVIGSMALLLESESELVSLLSKWQRGLQSVLLGLKQFNRKQLSHHDLALLLSGVILAAIEVRKWLEQKRHQ